jgi:transposase
MTRKYVVRLTEEERSALKVLVSSGKASARKITHARILLLADENSESGKNTDESIIKALQVGLSTVARVRRRLVEEGLESALNRQVQKNRRARKLDGEGEAFLIAVACSQAPEGRTAWTLKLLADRLIECEIVDSISTEAVRQTLKKTRSSHG